MGQNVPRGPLKILHAFVQSYENLIVKKRFFKLSHKKGNFGCWASQESVHIGYEQNYSEIILGMGAFVKKKNNLCVCGGVVFEKTNKNLNLNLI